MPQGQQRRLDLTSFLEIVVPWVGASGARGFQGCGSVFCSVRKNRLSAGIRNQTPNLAGALGLGRQQGPVVLADTGHGLFSIPQPCLHFCKTPTSL